jgi:DNA-binding HxlR family transcriptional regulator
MATEPRAAFCPYYHRAIELIGARWTGAIIRALLAGLSRFGELGEAIPGVSDRMLSERLKELETEGIVERRVSPSRPVSVEYRLTDKGRSLASIVEAVSEWATEWLAGDGSATVPAIPRRARGGSAARS